MGKRVYGTHFSRRKFFTRTGAGSPHGVTEDPKEESVAGKDKRCPAGVLESLKVLKDGEVEAEMSRLRRELKRGKWEGESDALANVLLGVLKKWPERRDVILQTMMLLLEGGLG